MLDVEKELSLEADQQSGQFVLHDIVKSYGQVWCLVNNLK